MEGQEGFLFWVGLAAFVLIFFIWGCQKPRNDRGE